MLYKCDGHWCIVCWKQPTRLTQVSTVPCPQCTVWTVRNSKLLFKFWQKSVRKLSKNCVEGFLVYWNSVLWSYALLSVVVFHSLALRKRRKCTLPSECPLYFYSWKQLSIPAVCSWPMTLCLSRSVHKSTSQKVCIFSNSAANIANLVICSFLGNSPAPEF